jgi:hypothetical protein
LDHRRAATVVSDHPQVELFVVWVFVWNGDFTVTLLLHGSDCGMIHLWAMGTIHR